MPEVTNNPPLFCCLFCTKAKLTKNHGGPPDKKEAIIPGQAFHMDLSFVSGPSNLEDMLQKGSKPATKIKTSRDGHIGFLTTINVALRYLWNQPIKSKDPPILYFDRFLQTHGIKKDKGTIINTLPSSYLAKSKVFARTARHEYNIAEQVMDVSLKFILKTSNAQ